MMILLHKSNRHHIQDKEMKKACTSRRARSKGSVNRYLMKGVKCRYCHGAIEMIRWYKPYTWSEMEGSPRLNKDDAKHDYLENTSNCHYLQGKKMKSLCFEKNEARGGQLTGNWRKLNAGIGLL